MHRATLARGVLWGLLALAIGWRGSTLPTRWRGDPCDSAHPTACYHLGLKLLPRAPGEARRSFGIGCSADHAGACYQEGKLYQAGLGGTQDLVLARDRFERACLARESYACAALGELYEEGQGGPQDLLAARLHYEKGCRRSETWPRRPVKSAAARPCLRLGELLARQGADGSALEAFRAACEAGSPAGCRRAGQVLSCGRGVERDLSEAARLMDRACVARDANACDQLLALYEAGALGSVGALPRNRQLRVRAAHAALLRGVADEAARRISALRAEGAIAEAEFLLALAQINQADLGGARRRLETRPPGLEDDSGWEVLLRAVRAIEAGEPSWVAALARAWKEEGRPDLRKSALFGKAIAPQDLHRCFVLEEPEPVPQDGSFAAFVRGVARLVEGSLPPSEELFLQAQRQAFSSEPQAQETALMVLIWDRASAEQRVRALPLATTLAEKLARQHPENLFWVGTWAGLLAEQGALNPEHLEALAATTKYDPRFPDFARGLQEHGPAAADTVSYVVAVAGWVPSRLSQTLAEVERPRRAALLLHAGTLVAGSGSLVGLFQGARLQKEAADLDQADSSRELHRQTLARAQALHGPQGLLPEFGSWPLTAYQEERLKAALEHEVALLEQVRSLAGLGAGGAR